MREPRKECVNQLIKIRKELLQYEEIYDRYRIEIVSATRSNSYGGKSSILIYRRDDTNNLLYQGHLSQKSLSQVTKEIEGLLGIKITGVIGNEY